MPDSLTPEQPAQPPPEPQRKPREPMKVIDSPWFWIEWFPPAVRPWVAIVAVAVVVYVYYCLTNWRFHSP